VLTFIKESPSTAGKREIARAFHLNGSQREALKKLLSELENEGQLLRGRGKRFVESGTLPSVTIVEISGLDADGDVLAKPVTWPKDGPTPPRIYMLPERGGRHALGIGDRVLAKLTRSNAGTYDGRTIRRLADAPRRMLAIYERVGNQGRLRPTNRRNRTEPMVADVDSMEAEPGELVAAELLAKARLGPPTARIVERFGGQGDARAVSLIAIHDHGIPIEFSAEAITQAEQSESASLGERTDLRDIRLITIDGADARDFDDAVWSEPDNNPKNTGGWHLMVAIADVAWYVRPGDALDHDAYERSTSVYFPDRVVPMLPEALSNGWCSLKPDEDRPCMVAHLWIDSDGNLLRHQFERGLMRSAARLTYEQVEAAREGPTDAVSKSLREAVLVPLYGAYAALSKYRDSRGVLDLNMPERQIILDAAGHITDIQDRSRLDSHRLIEEFMITANVAAAETLEKHRQPCMYRIHDSPTLDKLEALRTFLESIDLKLARGQIIQPAQFNTILERVAGTPNERLVNEIILRSQAQAVYSPENIGHFGLALRRYAHFTSPIRRYADLLVHRALIQGLQLGDGALGEAPGDFGEKGEYISTAERRAISAERDAVDRYIAAFLADRVGARFTGRVSGVTRFGLFVTLAESGGNGLVPISTLPDDRYDHDERHHALVGRRWGRTYRLGDTVRVILVEADAITGSLAMNLVNVDGDVDTSGDGQNTNAAIPGQPWRSRAPIRGKKRSAHPAKKNNNKSKSAAKRRR
jgi:ribonuclease R